MSETPAFEQLLAEVERLREQLQNREQAGPPQWNDLDRRFHAITPDILAEIDAEGRIHLINQAGRTWLDLDGDNPGELHLNDLYGSEEAQRLLSRGLAALEESQQWRGGLVVLQRKFTRRPVLQRLFRQEKGEHYLLLLRDMTGMVAEGLELVEAERGFRQMAEISPTGIFRVNKEGLFVYVNQRWCEITGIPREEIIGRPWGPELHPEDRERVAAKWREAKEKEIPFISEYRHVRGKGAYSWVLGQAAEEKDIAGEVTGFIGTVTDITEQKLTEIKRRTHLERQVKDSKDALDRTMATLQENERLYGAVIETVPNIIWVADTNGEINYLNHTWYQFSGRSREKSVGMAWAEGVPAKSRDSSLEYWWESLALEEPFVTPFRFLHRDGEIRTLEVTAKPIKNEAGETVQWVGVNRDITQEVQVRKQLMEAKRAAEDAAAVKANFLATMSHEIRTPMNGIMGAVNLLLQEPLSTTQNRYAELIHQSTGALLAVINDVLDYSKLEAGKLTLEQLDFDLAKLIADVNQLLLPSAKAKNLAMKTVLPEKAPLHFHGDPNRIRQILLNLVSNAVKFTNEGEVRITVRLEPPRGNRIPFAVAIRDTGIGISEENLNRMFSDFFQADASITRKYGGTGLGLAICRRLAHLMDGVISVDSWVGRGSIFTLYLSLPTAIHPPVSAPVNMNLTRNYARRALLVEDNQVSRYVAEKLLVRMGLKVDLAADGEEAVRKARQNAYDVIFMDIQMPVMDGITATTHIRQKGNPSSRSRIIAMTANALHKDREICRAAGMDGFIPKPIQRDVIISELDKWFFESSKAEP